MSDYHITIYTTLTCSVCQMAKQFLEDMNLEFEEVQVGINPLARIKLISQTQKLSVPQININGEWISGFDPLKILTVINHASET